MTIIDRARQLFAARRSPDGSGRFPTTRVANPARTLSSVIITPDTAITIPAVWACLRFLTQTTAKLPWHVMKDMKNGATVQDAHGVDFMLHTRASSEWSAFQFRETMLHWALRWGNGYAEIEFDGAGRPIALWPLHPERVVVCRDPTSKKLFYQVDGRMEFAPEEIFHLRGFGEGPVGVNVIAYAAESLGWARALQLFGAAFVGNGMNISGVITVKEQMSPEALKELRKEFESIYAGIRRTNKVAVLDDGMEWQQVQIDPDKGQFIQTNAALIDDVCRWFGVPQHKIMKLDRSTFNNIEQQSIEVVVDSISPWVKRFEDEADFKLFGQNRANLYSKMNMNALLRGDTAARSVWYKMMRENGCFSVNDILRLEDQNTIGPEGDKRVMQSQYTTLEQIGNAPITPPSAPSPASPASTPDADPSAPPPKEPPSTEEQPDESFAQRQLTQMYFARVIQHA